MVSLFVVNTVLHFLLLCQFPRHKSVADVTRTRYGNHTLDLFRTTERISVKREKEICSLQFLKVCRDADLVPVFLRFKLSNALKRDSSDV